MAAAGDPRFTSTGLSALSHRLMREFAAANKIKAGSGSEPDLGNLVFSPLSIYSALSLAAAGAEGSTLSEMLDVLGANSRENLAETVGGLVERALPDGQQPGGPRVEHACGLWHDAAWMLKQAYRDVAASSCKAVARAVDFCNKPEDARQQINRWVASATKNLIDSILPEGSVKSDTSVVVVTAIYFKGLWEAPFEKHLTKKSKFHRLDGSAVDAEFMRSERMQFIAEHDGFKMLEMPYDVHIDHPMNKRRRATTRTIPSRGPRYSMFVFLPDAHDGISMLVDKMASSPSFLEEHMPRTRVPVGDFRVPKFKLSVEINANRTLQDLGIKAAFDPTEARLPNILEDNGGEPLFLENVFHKAVIEVNEEGTEAAACTAMRPLPGAPAQLPKRVDFVVDHPFAFFVVEETSGVILFAGHVLDPTKNHSKIG